MEERIVRRPIKPFDMVLLCLSVVILVTSCAASVATHKETPNANKAQTTQVASNSTEAE